MPADPEDEGWDSFLSRAMLARDHAQALVSFQNKRILITGAGGSIGSAATLALAAYSPERLILLEASEHNLYSLHASLDRVPHAPEYTSSLGNVGDPTLLKEIFDNHSPQLVFHAAAFKHVPLMEQNPFAAIQNNALATHSLLRAAAASDVTQLILLSTDKAVDPISIMGASKRIAELFLLASPSSGIRTNAVRLGNVLGSAGSIVPLFRKQIATGSPITVAHPLIRRYFLTETDAVTLLLHAASEQYAPGILVPDLGEPQKVADLARYLITRHAIDQHSVVFTEPRPGDKMCESLLSVRESYGAKNQQQILHPITSPAADDDVLQGAILELQTACDNRSLPGLLSAVKRLVPEYEPSALLRPTSISSRGAA